MRKPSYRQTMHISPSDSVTGCLHVACIIARMKNPTKKKLVDKFGMNEKTAYRWMKAWREANGDF